MGRAEPDRVLRGDVPPGAQSRSATSESAPPTHDDATREVAATVRRVIAGRVRDPHLVEDLVQETLVRVLAVSDRVNGDDVVPYAITTARNLITSAGRRERVSREKAHLLVDAENGPDADDRLLRAEEVSLVGAALAHLSPPEREILLAHEIEAESTSSIASRTGSTPGAVAASLSRARAKLRVEYLLAQEATEPPDERCRPVLRALSLGDRRRQRETDVAGHVLRCDFCHRVAAELNSKWPGHPEDVVPVAVARDADVVVARQHGRTVAAAAGLSRADITLVATAISEVARNIVKFARRGEVAVSVVAGDGRTGVRVVAQDAGPGIPDVPRALEDGFSTYNGLGLGLPGCRRLMDEFEITSQVGRGTTVTMTKWR